MSAPPPTDRTPQGPTPDDLARGILHTDISPGLARVMAGLFVAALVTLPALQVALEVLRFRPIQELELFTRRPTRENLHSYEKDLERNSTARRLAQPYLQLLLSAHLGAGNNNVVLGRDGWLFYRPGVDLLSGPGLLDAGRLGLRRKELLDAGEANPSPDPRPAIRAFHADCARAGVHLVVVPIPDKAMLQPAELTARLAHAGVVANTDHARLLEELRSAGVDVFDPTPANLDPRDPPRFLRQDSHWTPEWMEAVARGLAEHVKGRVPFPRGTERRFLVREARASRVGDLVDMLQLPAGQTLFPPQAVTLRQVLDSDGAAWAPRAEADVLLLGDSFSNIYCAADMGWGEAAGFPAQLARFLGRDVDVIARNGAGSTGTRRELARRPDPLGGKLVVLWAFAARELAVANWEVVPMPQPSGPRPQPATPPAESGPLVVEGTLLAVSRVPAPYTVPYKDCLTYVKLRIDRVVAGGYEGAEMIATLWGMKDNVLLPAARYPPGKRLRLNVVPLRQAPVSLGAVRSADDLEDCEHRPYFVVEEEGL